MLLPLFPRSQSWDRIPPRHPHGAGAVSDLLIAPAIALDLLFQRARDRDPPLAGLVLALTSGIVFVVVLTVVEWPFANFLMSSRSQIASSARCIQFRCAPESLERLRDESFLERAALWRGLTEAAAIASVEIWLGLRLGRWMQGIPPISNAEYPAIGAANPLGGFAASLNAAPPAMLRHFRNYCEASDVPSGGF